MLATIRDLVGISFLVIVAIALYVWIWRSVNRANDEESSRESRWYAGMSRLAEHARGKLSFVEGTVIEGSVYRGCTPRPARATRSSP